MAENLKEKTIKGLFWGAMNSGTTQLLNLVIGISLGRLIGPAEYGIVGVLNIFTLIAGNLQSSGFSQGLVNLKSPQASDYNSVFWFNILSSFGIYAVLFIRNSPQCLYDEEHDEQRTRHCWRHSARLFGWSCHHVSLFRFLLLELGMATNHLYCGVESWSLLLRFMASILPFHVRARQTHV